MESYFEKLVHAVSMRTEGRPATPEEIAAIHKRIVQHNKAHALQVEIEATEAMCECAPAPKRPMKIKRTIG